MNNTNNSNSNKQNNLNQFSNYKSQLKSISNVYSIAQDFDYILNNIFCTYSFSKGKTKWKSILSI